jgi:hypothetical protein
MKTAVTKTVATNPRVENVVGTRAQELSHSRYTGMMG